MRISKTRALTYESTTLGLIRSFKMISFYTRGAFFPSLFFSICATILLEVAFRLYFDIIYSKVVIRGAVNLAFSTPGLLACGKVGGDHDDDDDNDDDFVFVLRF